MAELIGHDEARRALRAVLARGTLPHALLVTGESGIGKRRFAAWLAAARWCERPEPAERPCGRCRSCRTLATRNHPDLLVLARNPSREEDPDGLGSRHEITVEQVRRQLIPWLAVRAVEGRGRVVIVDGADTLNEPAQNALLKTLEEPPRGALLLLLASHADALLDTVRSRCQELRLFPLPRDDMARLPGGEDPRRVALARGRPGRLPELARLNTGRLFASFDAVLAGELPGTAFASLVQTLLAEAGRSDADGAADPEGEGVTETAAATGTEVAAAAADADGGGARAAPTQGALASSPAMEPDDRQRLVAELLLGRLAERVAAGELPGASAEALQAAQSALLELGPDLRRHIPPAVAWTAVGIELAAWKSSAF